MLPHSVSTLVLVKGSPCGSPHWFPKGFPQRCLHRVSYWFQKCLPHSIPHWVPTSGFHFGSHSRFYITSCTGFHIVKCFGFPPLSPHWALHWFQHSLVDMGFLMQIDMCFRMRSLVWTLVSHVLLALVSQSQHWCAHWLPILIIMIPHAYTMLHPEILRTQKIDAQK